MTALDVLMILLGVVLVALFAWQRMVRALTFLVVIWVATLVAALLYRAAAFRTQAVTGANVILAEGLFFVGIFSLALLVGFFAVRAAYPDTRLPRLGVLDPLMGAVIGCIIAMLVVTVLINGWGLMLNGAWKDGAAWSRWSAPPRTGRAIGAAGRCCSSSRRAVHRRERRDILTGRLMAPNTRMP